MKALSVRLACAALALTAAASSVRAQEAGGGAPPPPAGQPGQPPPAPAPPLPPGVYVVSAQSAVVGGNAASARERALDEALRQAVDQALAEILGPEARTVDAKGVKALEARARSFVRRYRALEEGEANGSYAIRLEAEVDLAPLRRAAERLTPPPAAGAPPVRVSPPGLLLVSAGEGAAASALASALAAAGTRAQLGEGAGTGARPDIGAALRAAARAQLSEVAVITAQVTDEGAVRGTGKVAVSCHVTVRVLAVASGLPIAEQAATPRVFADRADAARADCLVRAAADLAPRLVPAGGGGTGGGADLRTVTIEADVLEPAAIPALLKTVRSIGAVSSAELRRITGGRAEIRVRTRTPAPALALALSRDAGGVITLSDAEAAGDLVRLRVRLRAAAQPGGSTP